MDPEDKFYVVFNEKIYTYSVIEKKTVAPEDMSLLEDDYGKDTVVLMTCWPAGTTSGRLVVVGKITE
jgi:LPXTG-site transpeptidase (sortase) family protein